MELATTLTSHTQNAVREEGINSNYWYAVGWAHQLKPGKTIPVVIWQQAIAVYRNINGQLHALEDFCPHKGVGKVHGCNLACAYHGWEFDSAGSGVKIFYLADATVRSYPIQAKYNLVWIFPGEPNRAATCQIPDILEFAESERLVVPISAHSQVHFSICNENTMDVFHGFLHQGLQGWFDLVLISLKETEASVRAEYHVSYQGHMANLGLSDRSDTVTTTLPITVEYRYPHCATSLQRVSSLYLMRLPIRPNESRSFALFFFKVCLPHWVLQPIKPLLTTLLQRFVLSKFLAQDLEMSESEQRNYLANLQRRYIEINPAIIAIQRLIVRQYEQFMQKSIQPFLQHQEKKAIPNLAGGS